MEKETGDLYEVMIDDSDFLDELWNEYDNTTKYSILEKSGCKMVEEWEAYRERNESREP